MLGARKANIGDDAKADMLTGFRFELLVEIDRVLVYLTDRIGEIEQGEQAGRMPGRARSQFAALQQDAIAPALLGKVIEGRNAHHATADHHCPRLRLHGSFLSNRNCVSGHISKRNSLSREGERP